LLNYCSGILCDAFGEGGLKVLLINVALTLYSFKTMELYRNKNSIMKKIYTSVFVLSILLLAGCSKDFLKSYDDRIIGTWQITDVNKFGIGGSISNLPFKEGSFSFIIACRSRP
jgi:hypothetical protein